MRTALGTLLLLAVAGCTAAPPPSPEPAPVRKRAEAPVEAQPFATPEPKPKPRTEPVPKPAVAIAPPEPPVNDDPSQLFGLDGHGVADLLGPASFVRRDGPAEVWQYRASACVLDVYLYREADGLSVAHVDLRRRERASEPPRDCFRNLLVRKN